MTQTTTVRPITYRALVEIGAERGRQIERFGVQDLPIGTGGPVAVAVANLLRALCKANDPDRDTLAYILAEEVGEMFAETDPERVRKEAVQAAAVLVNLIETLDRRQP